MATARNRWLVPVGSLALFGAAVALFLGTARDTLGYDYRCYESAAQRILDGKALYDNAFSINVATCPGTYTYPPPFAVAIIPWLGFGAAAALLWCLAMAGCFLAGVAVMPVRRDVRWLVVILGALNWPLLYSIKLGQVGPILFLAFAIAWRWIDRPGRTGVAFAVGTLVKVQPALAIVWAVVTGRVRAAAIAVVSIAGLSLAASLVTGVGVWATYGELLRGLNGSLRTSHNLAPGAVAHFAGAPDAVASSIQLVAVLAALGLLLAAWGLTGHEASLMATIVASQIVASPLRDHYAVLLLLPTAWLVQRGRSWAVVFPLLGWASLFSQHDEWLPAATVPLIFFGCLAAVLAEGLRVRTLEEIAGVPLRSLEKPA